MNECVEILTEENTAAKTTIENSLPVTHGSRSLILLEPLLSPDPALSVRLPQVFTWTEHALFVLADVQTSCWTQEPGIDSEEKCVPEAFIWLI